MDSSTADLLAKGLVPTAIITYLYIEHTKRKVRKLKDEYKNRNLLSMNIEYTISEEEEQILKDLMLFAGYTSEKKYVRDMIFKSGSVYE